MCGTFLCPELPQTSFTIMVTHCHKTHRWHAHACGHHLSAEGDLLEYGVTHYDFGPFEVLSEVRAWVRDEAANQLRLMTMQGNAER